ncbi:MAG: 4Fe-4S ferredoxin [Thermoprotei archaeon]|nr:MAG: 4Fe-4S ferredoxin [Thermoprotei archaeon]RLF19235.1 MAG: 4Fe-4S ferredoxin [Thermoprotei archaeon]
MSEYRRLLDSNVCSKDIRRYKKLLIFGTCLKDEHPEIVAEWSKGRATFHVCLESEHVNMVGFKLASILCRVPIEEIVILTVDGSLHCVQLHMMAEEVNRFFGNRFKIRHLVYEKGKVIEIDPEVVKTARFLTKVRSLLALKHKGTSS